jgi:putative ATP-dependent endonuclease of the OLD family
MAVNKPSSGPAIYRLRIERFRGIRRMEWHPAAGLNMIVGPADSGKSTVLEALSLALTWAPTSALTEFDYFGRDTSKGFTIEAVLAVGDGAFLGAEGFPHPPLQGWRAGQLTDLPDEDNAEPVLVCRLTGQPNCEAVYEVVGAGDDVRVPLSRALRQRIGLVRLGVGERAERDLRLVQGGALDRFLDGRALRQTVVQSVLKTPIHDQLGTEPANALGEIESSFKNSHLPHPVRLGLVGTPGVSLAASVGLTIGASDETALPLASWGSGTRRLAALEIAALGISKDSVAVVDEPETGLEPYRQRALVSDLSCGGKRQAFVTTHAPSVLSAGISVNATIWRMNLSPGATQPGPKEVSESASLPSDGTVERDNSHALIALSGAEPVQIAQSQPEVLVARIPVVCEGVTEVGFATRIFQARFGEGFQRRGLYCLDAGGHYKAVPICQQLVTMGFCIAAVVDDEGKKTGAWKDLERKAILLRWRDGACLEKAVFGALTDALLQEIPAWAQQVLGRAAKHQLAEIRRALDFNDKTKSVEHIFGEVGRQRFLEAVCEAACPRPEGSQKPRGWFKSFDGGFLLADKLLAMRPRPETVNRIDAFITNLERLTET